MVSNKYLFVMTQRTKRSDERIIQNEATNLFFNMHEHGEDSLDRFRHVADQSFDHIVITDVAGYVVYANTAAIRNTGYTLGELVGAKASLWGRQMSPDFYRRMWHTIKYECGIFESELINRRKGGQLYTAQMRIWPICSRDDEIAYFAAIERDISEVYISREHQAYTDRKHALAIKRLACQHEYHRTLLEKLPTPILFADGDGVAVFANPAFYALSPLIPFVDGARALDVLRLLELSHIQVPCPSDHARPECLFICNVNA